MTDIILWRHGQTDYNVGRRVQGRVDIPLNAVGRAQAEAGAELLADVLRSPGGAHEAEGGASAPCTIVSSPLRRARATAQALAARLAVEVTTHPGLAERDFGQWEGLTVEEIESGWPDAYAMWRTGHDPQGVEVEPRSAVGRRFSDAVRSLAATAGQGPLVVVAHGSAITQGTTALLGMDASSWFGLRGLDNAHWARLRSSHRTPGWELRDWNAGAEPTALLP
ncbi:phosphoglycerate mutase [Actinomyces sp. Chiba101]|uniref:Probable phosphoglycerate mutase n=1 Tax=Actinomyces denticolens TaxID=52767 RepID=A0ABY1I6P2_9ACTO|nr:MULTISPECIES: histidine phosphatase family protein [Actinomyces]BAW93374.1 phosphoglycerate mutase [Actinomyces sp. Chiba101]GAV93794.1 phosphoglycerate mutase [Actinomyces denticolens]SHI70397.1 probable phosphoglycerate mutase [Actinomyces denticolens]SUU03404.1 Phosphoglyceromutase [Actinomyces denticolens]